MASQSKAAAMPKGKVGARRWGALCAGAGAAALVLPAAARTTGFAAPARTSPLTAAPAAVAPAFGAGGEQAAQGASILGGPAVFAASGMAAAAALAAGAASKKPRRGARAVAQRAACPCAEAAGKKTACLHPDKPMMFACADCPRRTGVVAQADGSADVATAAFLGEDSVVMAKKTQCLHPDKPMMMACADCPRRGGKACATECSESAAAAYVGEGDAEVALNAKKTQCIHPDKPIMFACNDCPRRSGKTSTTATADFEGAEVAAAAFLGEGCAAAKKTQCLHPDKPMMLACGDCPRRGKAAVPAQEELNGTDCAAAAYVGECSGAGALGKKTQCLHPDKPMPFACADCPRRGGKAPATEAEGAELAAAAFVGEVAATKTQCIHPDKPMMFACADCPRRGGKAPVAELDGEEVAAAAYTGECACAGVAMPAKKTQCIHPDKPMMFACADCPRRNGAAPESDADGVAAAAFVGEGAVVGAKKTQCVHPDKPMMFACADCPRRGKAPVGAPQADMDGEAVAAAAYTGEGGCAMAAKKTQCVHPDKPMMFACADCPRRGKAPNAPQAGEDLEVATAAFVSESASTPPCVVSKKDRCLHPDKPMMFACADCPRRG